MSTKDEHAIDATRNIQPPEQFNFIARDWPVWKQRFQRFRRLTDMADKQSGKQVDMLIYSMGEKADEIYSSFKLSKTDAEDYEKVIAEFEKYFVGKRNIVYDRAMFQLRCQEEGEPFEEFVTALHTLADYCNYGDLKEELIRDRIVVGVYDKTLMEKLMLLDKLDLAKAKEICKQWETVRKQQGILSGERSAQSSALNQVKKSRECKFCNRRHEWTKEKCPAFGKTCSNCGLQNHFAVCCDKLEASGKSGHGGVNVVSSVGEDSDFYIL